MSRRSQDREQVLQQLEETVAATVAFFSGVDETLFDGYQTAHEVLSHLVYWHREYVTVSQVLCQEERPCLRKGTFAELNEQAYQEFARYSLPVLSQRLVLLHKALASNLRRLPDWRIDFPIKQDSRFCSVETRLARIDSHIRSHVNRLERASRLGAEWVNAYYVERS
jgi:hypothetical protein